MSILLVEDDYLQADAVLPVLRKEFPDIRVDIIKTEQEFRQRLEEILAAPPDLVIMDVMIRWTKPSPKFDPPPSDVTEGGRFRAGLRCERLLAERNPEIPVILYSVLGTDDFRKDELPNRPGVLFLSKIPDPGPFVRAVGQLLKKARRAG